MCYETDAGKENESECANEYSQDAESNTKIANYIYVTFHIDLLIKGALAADLNLNENDRLSCAIVDTTKQTVCFKEKG